MTQAGLRVHHQDVVRSLNHEPLPDTLAELLERKAPLLSGSYRGIDQIIQVRRGGPLDRAALIAHNHTGAPTALRPSIPHQIVICLADGIAVNL